MPIKKSSVFKIYGFKDLQSTSEEPRVKIFHLLMNNKELSISDFE